MSDKQWRWRSDRATRLLWFTPRAFLYRIQSCEPSCPDCCCYFCCCCNIVTKYHTDQTTTSSLEKTTAGFETIHKSRGETYSFVYRMICLKSCAMRRNYTDCTCTHSGLGAKIYMKGVEREHSNCCCMTHIFKLQVCSLSLSLAVLSYPMANTNL